VADLRYPYVGEGADGARRSAQIDLEQADCMDPGEERDERLLSAARWELQADRLEREDVSRGASGAAIERRTPPDSPAGASGPRR